MQATVTTTTRQFGFNRFNTALVTLGLAAAIAVGAAGAAMTDNLPLFGDNDAAIVLPKAHISVNAGEGMVAGTSDVSAAVRAHTSDQQGNGILGGNLAIEAQPHAYPSRGMGEGILGGYARAADLTPASKAYDEAGKGEGWLANGRPRTTIKAYTSEFQGEGLIDTSR